MGTNNMTIIDEMYDNMLDTAANMAKEGINPENVAELEKTFEKVEKELGTVEVPVDVDTAPTSEEPEGTKVLVNYDPKTGEIAADDNSADMVSKVAESSWLSFNADDKEVDMNILKGVFSEEDLKEITDLSTIVDMIKRRKAGEVFNPYSEFPDKLKSIVDDIIAKAPPTTGEARMKDAKAFVSKSILDSIIGKYNSTSNAVMDLDALLSGFDADLEKATSEMSKELGDMMMSFDDQRKAEIDAAIKRCEAEGKTDAIAKFEAMKNTIDSAYNLNDLAEFCKTCRIKKFDIEKPSRVYTSFNSKYIKHKYNINNIADCAIILARHGFSEEDAIKFTIAFCKYAMNMNPDNIEEHTFMYYTIRNIIAIDRVNPKGKLYEAMNDRTREFYDGFLKNVRKCVDNLNERNSNK